MSRLLVLLCCFFALPAFAQQAPPPQNLAEALNQTYWNAEQRGPLLAIAPERVPLKSQLGKVVQPPSAPAQGYNALDIAPFFDQAPLRAGKVTIVAPQTMRLFTRPTLAPDQAFMLSKDTAGAELLASLTSGQWQLLGSPSGLGLSDLSERQRGFFQVLLPSKARLQPTTAPGESVLLTEAQCQSFRLRLSKQIQMSYMVESYNNRTINFGEVDQGARQRYQLVLNEQLSGSPEEHDPLLAKLFPKVPNRLKRGDISFSLPRLDPAVSLADVKSLGELLERISLATRMRFKADYRLKGLTLWIRGERARSGDLLQALCLGACGTFRKIDDNTFLLTEDLEGLTVRQAFYEQWQRKGQELQAKQQEERNKKMKANGAVLVTDNPDQLSPELIKKVEAPYQPRLQSEERGVLATELPPAFQQRLEKASQISFAIGDSSGGSTTGRIRTDRVMLHQQPRSEWILPGVGTFPCYGLNLAMTVLLALSNTAGTVPVVASSEPLLAPTWKTRGLVLAPKNPTEAVEAVASAKQAGMSTVCIAVSLERATALPLVDAAIAEGKKRGIPVGVQLLALQQPEGAGLSKNRTILGMPSSSFYGMPQGPYFIEPTVAAAQKLGAFVHELAQRPGLSEVLVSLSIPPGYMTNQYVPAQEALGCSAENRAAFFQKTGGDILDIPLQPYTSYPVSLGFFSKTQPEYVPLSNGNYGPDPNFQDLAKDWTLFRQKQLQQFLNTLDGSLKTLPIPCFRTFPNFGTIGVWSALDLSRPMPFSDGDSALLQTKKLSPIVLRQASAGGNTKPEYLKSWLRVLAKADTKPVHADGIVLDLSQATLTEAKTLLGELKLAEDAP